MPYYHPADCPAHLTLAIEAVSLAYLWHQTYSDAALTTARQRYIRALRITNKILESPKEAIKNTSLLATLLLDLFEKITGRQPLNSKSWTSHVNGALALVRLRGLEHFQDPAELHVLVRLNNHFLITCVASGSLVSNDLLAIRRYVEERLDVPDYTLQMSDSMIGYAKLQSEKRSGILSDEECIELSLELDAKLHALDSNMPPSWGYSRTLLSHKSERSFDLYFDTYSHRNKCQARNIFRVARILLNESLIDLFLESPIADEYLASMETASNNIQTLASEICASVPQYVDCEEAARHKVPTQGIPEQTHGPCSPLRANHMHTPQHQADCYTLIFPLYAAGRSRAMTNVQPWAIKQLHYLGSHFGIRNAEVVAGILEREAYVGPWEVFALLGSYAFAT